MKRLIKKIWRGIWGSALGILIIIVLFFIIEIIFILMALIGRFLLQGLIVGNFTWQWWFKSPVEFMSGALVAIIILVIGGWLIDLLIKK